MTLYARLRSQIVGLWEFLYLLFSNHSIGIVTSLLIHMSVCWLYGWLGGRSVCQKKRLKVTPDDLIGELLKGRWPITGVLCMYVLTIFIQFSLQKGKSNIAKVSNRRGMCN